MNWIKNTVREIFELFVDDGAFALAILVWLCITGCAAYYLRFQSVVAAVVLFAGLALILIENTARYARQRRTGR
jgi:Flp pilus assembly protein TadB